jgi:hypothetical protein
MNTRIKFAPAALVAALAIPVLTNGCSSDGSSPLCCTEFKVGATVDVKIGGSAQSQIAVQAVADVAAIGSAAIDDLTAACRGIATELDAPKAEQDAAETKTDKQEKLSAWCSLAVKQIGSFKATAGGTIKLVIEPVKCEASISAKANCQAKCSGSAQCDLKANPPKCTGGTLSVACKGGCTAEAGAKLQCEGKCEGGCTGSCTAQGGVDCTGKCEGTCSAGAGAGETGIQADGSCKGSCSGTCSVTKPGATCSGSCKGECGVKCTGSANASVQCNGKCDADFEPLKCEGGKLEGGCKVEAKCDANCDASVSAKAECTPPKVSLQVSGSANAEAALKLKGVIEANFGVVAAFQARLKGVLDATGSFAANANGIADIKAACIPVLFSAAGQAVSDLGASFKATGQITGSL